MFTEKRQETLCEITKRNYEKNYSINKIIQGYLTKILSSRIEYNIINFDKRMFSQ